MAIVSGLLGNVLVEEPLRLGPVAPFDAAVVAMVVGGGVVLHSWPENHGDEGEAGLVSQFANAAAVIVADRKVALLGAMQALYEGAMYTFIFLWTPALSPSGEKLPHGLVFACFMTACMLGSALAGLLMKRHRPEAYMHHVFIVSAAALAVPFFFHLDVRHDDRVGSSLGEAGVGGIGVEGRLQLVAFCVFEACVGVFWPSMMAMRAQYVPEQKRSTIISIFRVPLNLLVCLSLHEVSRLPLAAMFGLCVAFLLTCAAMQLHLQHVIFRHMERTGSLTELAPMPGSHKIIKVASAAASATAATAAASDLHHHQDAEAAQQPPPPPQLTATKAALSQRVPH